jgi:hypothetical protein
LHELADELRLLPRDRGHQAAHDLSELELRLLAAVDEAEDADDQGEQRDEGEEDLVGDRAREERAVVVEERAEDPACGYEDAASPFGAAGAGASAFGASPFAGVASFVLPSALVSAFVSAFASGFASPPSFGLARLSVLYQPPPLNTIAGVAISLRGRLPQLGHVSSVASVYDWTCENVCPQWSQW